MYFIHGLHFYVNNICQLIPKFYGGKVYRKIGICFFGRENIAFDFYWAFNGNRIISLQKRILLVIRKNFYLFRLEWAPVASSFLFLFCFVLKK